MTSLSPMTPTEASIGEQFGSDATHVSNPQQAPLRRAHYVKVVDLATLNNLDVEKIKLETTKKRSESLENLEGEDTNASRDDESSSISPKYQKRVVPSIGGFNLCLLVGDINIVVEKTRVDKSQVRLAECEVGDETGTLSLRARDEQISILQEISSRGGAVVLRNCSLELYQGKFIRLAVSKWGKIHSFPDGVSSTPTPPPSMNDNLHLSIVDLNDVAGDDWNTLPPESPGDNSQRDSTLSSHDSTGGRDKHARHPSHSPRYRPNHRGGVSHSKDKRSNRQKKTGAPVPGYNANIVHMVPGVSSLPLYTAPQFNYPRFDQHSMPNMYHQNQQQQPVHQEDFSYMSYQEYTMNMQMEAMRLSYQHQATQHQNRAGSHVYHPISVQGVQMPNQHPNQVTDNQFQPNEATTKNELLQPKSQSPGPSMPAAPVQPHISPESRGAASQYDTPMSTARAWSIKQEAESPMMNPHAAVFNSGHIMPALSLPGNQYYAQNASFSSAQYVQTGQVPGQVHTETYPTGPQESPPDDEIEDNH
jgi:hypothetical protein